LPFHLARYDGGASVLLPTCILRLVTASTGC
jgi:hypothetical protein